MALFAYSFTRDITTSESFSRVIDAPDAEAAARIAEALAWESNQSCPDDVAADDNAPDIGGFYTNAQGDAAPGAEADVTACAHCAGVGTIGHTQEPCRPCDGSGIAPDDADLAEAAAGETCDGCGRASIDCSRAPCPDVIADRGED